MRPVHEFKANFAPDERIERISDTPTGDVIGSTELHDTDSSVRNLCLVWTDGRRAFFNYAYLVSVDLMLTDPLNSMRLDFSGQIVTLKGYQLSLLFDLLIDHSPKTITATNPRYYLDGQMPDALVSEILVKTE